MIDLKANRISPRHWDEIRTDGAKFYVPKKLFLVLDEMKQYFGSGKQAPKLSKEPTADELALKERFDLTREFGQIVNWFVEQTRSVGSVICGASQSPNKSDCDYPDFINFPVMILGQTNAQQSIQSSIVQGFHKACLS